MEYKVLHCPPPLYYPFKGITAYVGQIHISGRLKVKVINYTLFAAHAKDLYKGHTASEDAIHSRIQYFYEASSIKT